MSNTLNLDGVEIPFQPGQTVMQAAEDAGVTIPHLCHHKDYHPHGSCKICTVLVNGRRCSACTFPAAEGQTVISDSDQLTQDRRRLTQMLFVEGNHFCPSCEKSGSCQLQHVAYELDMLDNHFPQFYPQRHIDSSHPDILLDRNRCIFCSLCVRASQERDGKNVFALGGRGIHKELIVNSPSGLLQDSDLAVSDEAAQICPTGAILIKRTGYCVPIGKRAFDHPIQVEPSHDD
jgi:[NiFe] hydrogenase diaphorase moiety small subunit